MNEEEKPPSLPDSKRNCSPSRNSRVNPSNYNWIPIWRRGVLPSVDFDSLTLNNSLFKH